MDCLELLLKSGGPSILGTEANWEGKRGTILEWAKEEENAETIQMILKYTK